ncbi:GerAB/ArcD/ProY family transporter [Neobacillus drentensis]|jgi:spore germination protein KB|uniref:GerAB/ArcD/ProY family transporter n=1 Tax=Neobacillus drentensis TaxID=220684 RepID=UPI000BF70D1A|nr:spore gernimation protein KB [Bacillus sp. AFS006103]
MSIEKISPFQLFCLMYLFELGSAIVVGLGLQAKQDAWLAILLGMGGGLCLYQIYSYLYLQFPDQPLTGYIIKILGKFIGTPIAFIYCLYFLYIAARVLRDFGDLLITSALDETPLYIINSLMILLIIYGLSRGIEVIGRTSESVFFIMIFLGFIGIMFTNFSGIVEVVNLAPFFESGWKTLSSTVFKQTYTFPFGEMIVFTMVLPHLNKNKYGRKIGIYALLASGFTLSITIALEIAVLGPKGVSISQFPLLDTIGRVNIGNFIQRLDIIVVATLIIGVFVKITIFFYAGYLGLASIFHLTKKKQKAACLLLLGILILIYSIKMSSNFAEHLIVGLKWVPIYLHLPLQTGVPLILFLITWVRKSLMKNKKEIHEVES